MKKVKKTIASVAAVAASASAVAGVVVNKAEFEEHNSDHHTEYITDDPSAHPGYTWIPIEYGDQAGKYIAIVQGGGDSGQGGKQDTSQTGGNNTTNYPNPVDYGLVVNPTQMTFDLGATPLNSQNINVVKNLVPTETTTHVTTTVSAGSQSNPNGSPSTNTDWTRVTKAAKGTLTFSSNNQKVATVDPYTGVVTPVGPGTAEITVVSTAPTEEHIVRIENVNGAVSIGSAGERTSTSIGSVRQLTAKVDVTVTGTPKPTITGVTLDTNNLDLVGEVNSVTAKGTQSLKIGGNGTSSATVSIKYGQTGTLKATVNPSNTNQNVGWTSSNQAVATVSSSGVVTAVKAGSATITARAMDDQTKYATANVTVSDPNKAVVWSSSNPAVVAVDASSGKTSANAIGRATITATSVVDSTKTGSYDVEVSENSPSEILPQSISLDSDNYQVEVGKTKQANATFNPTNTTNQNVTWSIVSGSEYASVDANGTIHGLKKGEATLKVTAEAKDASGKEVSATAKVTVIDSSDDSSDKVTVTYVSEHGTAPAAVKISKGQTVSDPGAPTGNTEGYTFQGWFANQACTAQVEWSTPINENTTYYAKWDREAPRKATVIFDGNGGSVIGTSTKEYNIDDEKNIVLNDIPTATREGYSFTGWNTSANGTGTAITESSTIKTIEGVPSYTIYAQWKENTKEATGVDIYIPDFNPVDPPRPPLEALGDPSVNWINLDDVTIHVGDTVPLKAVVTPEDAVATGKTWTASDPSIASVTSEGILTGNAIGTTTVTVALPNGVKDTATIHVIAAEPTNFDIDFGTSGGRVKVGESIQLGTKNWSPNGLPESSKSVSWTVTNGTGSATIDQTGRLTGVAEGTVTVTATSTVKNGLSKSATVTVYKDDIEPTGTDIVDPTTGVSINDIALKVGQSKTLAATITPVNATTKTGKTWSIADPSIATVTQDGTVTGVAEGTTTVTVTLENGVKDTATVRVSNSDIEPTGTDIVDPRTGVSLDNIKIQEGETKPLTAVITPANANTKTGKTWSVSDPTVASVDPSGNITGIKPGTTTVTVTLENGVKDTATVEVTPRPSTDIVPTGVSLGTKDVYVYVGDTRTLTATITPANANVYTQKSWYINDSSVATIDQNGTVTGVKAGNTTVTVKLANGVSDTATVHVLDKSTPSYNVNFYGNGGTLSGNTTVKATAEGGYTLYSNSFPTATRSGYKFSGWNTSSNGTGTWVSAPYTFKADTALYAQWTLDTVAPTSVDISVPVTTVNPNGTVNTTYVSADNMSLKVGETKLIKATVLPYNATNKSVTYSIADPSIAKIDQNGNITGLRAGVTTATVRTVNGLTDTITVTVTPNSSIPNLYIENIKSEYPAGKKIPVTLNILDADRGERLYVYYQVDSNTPVLADTITSTAYWQNLEVEIPSNLSIGKHSFSFFVRDAAGNRSDDRGSAYVRGLNGYNGYYDPYYDYDYYGYGYDPYYGYDYYGYDYPYYWNGSYYGFDPYYYNGDAFITDVSKYNPNRNDSRTWGTRFKADITNSDPTLTLAARLQDKVKIGDELPANLTVKDDNVGQRVTVYYQIDNGNPVDAGSFVSDGNAKNISVNIPTSGISAGEHVVTFYAVDEAGARSNANGNVTAWTAMGTNAGANQQTVTFTNGDGSGYKDSGNYNNGGNAPIVDIFKANGYKTTEDVAVTISVLEKDAGQKVTTYYRLDGGAETVIKSFKSTGRANTQNLNLGKLSEGTHTLEVWAIDEDGLRSDAADGLYTFSVSRADNGTVVVTPQQPVYNTTTIKTGVEAKGSKAGIAAAVVGAVAAVSAVVLKKKRK